MSKIEEATVTCHRCDEYYDIEVFTSVNCDHNPELKGKIITGQIYNSVCPNCEAINHTPYDILYHDMKNKFMIWLSIPNQDNILYFQNKSLSLSQKYLSNDYRLRICRFPYHFNEKIFVLESALDDRLIELYKFQYKIKNHYPLETKFEFLYFEEHNNGFLKKPSIKWRMVFDDGRSEILKTQVNLGIYNYYKKIITQLEPNLNFNWYMVDWQFPFGYEIKDNNLIQLPNESEVTDIETNKVTRTFPHQFLDVLERTGKGMRL